VTAGIVLLLKIRVLRKVLLGLLGGIRVLTLLVASLLALVEKDLKKLIAYRTLHQISLILGVLRMGQTYLAGFHLFTHAFFKRLLFISAGVLI